MWDYDHDTLPSSLRDFFKKSNLVHNYNTRSSSKGKLHYPKASTIKHGVKSFRHQGVTILNKLKDLSIYTTNKVKSKFLKELKSLLLLDYIK